MSIFLDTNVIFSLYDESSEYHSVARSAADRCLRGQYGPEFSSDYVYDEVLTLTRERTGQFEAAQHVGNRLRGAGGTPPLAKLETVTPELFHRSIQTFERYDDHDLSFTDASIVALMTHLDIDHLLSFDSDFDGIVDRLDPCDIASVD